MSPVGPVFLFARLNADGLAGHWLTRACGREAPPALCAARRDLPSDSQTLLWGDGESPIGRHVWQAQNEAERWAWVDMIARANRAIIADQPLAFAAAAVRGGWRQLIAFRPLDDECPEGCGRNRRGGIAYVLARDRPTALPALLASAQVQDTMPKALMRAVILPVTVLALALLPLAAWRAWRRRDATACALACALLAALLTNAAMAGALSDVHDRYQSRLAWVAPWLLALLWIRWRQPAARAGLRAQSACPVGRQPS